jgi:uncharacterized protein (TIGR02118 family)
MNRVSILYPNRPGSRFDLDYYFNIHMPRSIQLLSAGEGFRSVLVECGVSGANPDSAPSFIAGCHYEFDSYERFVTAFSPHAEELRGDMSNYTDVEPIIQVNEIRIRK